MNRKGFVYLFEIVIVSIILIVSIPYIIPPFEGKIDWGESRLVLTGKDVLKVMDSKGYLDDIMEENRTSIDNYVKSIFGEDEEGSIGFNIKSEGVYKNEIRVACNCTSEKRAVLQSILSPIYFNGRLIKFTVFKFKYENLDKLDMDVIFLNEFNDLTTIKDDFEDEVKSKIREGVGIVEYVDLNNARIHATEDLQKEIFGIDNTSTSPSGNLTFRNRTNSSKINYELGKIFYGVDTDAYLGIDNRGKLILWENNYDVRTRDMDGDGKYEVDVSNDSISDYEYTGLEEGYNFTINNYNFSVEKVRRNGTTVLFNIWDEYEFSNFVANDAAYPVDNNEDRIVLESSAGKPGIIINRTRERGRTVWISKGNGDDIRSLVKSSVLWASRRGWWNILKSVGGEKIQVRRSVSGGEEVYEPYIVLMELWYLY